MRAVKAMFDQCSSARAVAIPRNFSQQAQDKAVMLQRFVRGVYCRRELALRRSAAHRLQRQARVFLARQRLAKRRAAVFRIQPAFDVAYCRWKLLERKSTVARFQAYVKMWTVRRGFLRLKAAQTSIARYYRGTIARRHYRRVFQAVHLVLNGFKGAAIRAQYRLQRTAARRIQAAWRHYLVRDELLELHAAATRLAAAWRRRQQRARHCEVLRAGRILVRGLMTCRQMRWRKSRIAAATAIASAWRRRSAGRHLELMVGAARRIQLWWRDLNTCTSYRDFAAEVLAAAKAIRRVHDSAYAVKIQRWFRTQRLKPTPFRNLLRAVTKLQAHFRRRQAVEEVACRAATLGVRVRDMVSKQVFLAKDKRGRLTRSRDFQPGDTSEAAHRIRPIVDLAKVSARQSAQLKEAIATVQSLVKFHYYIACVVRIQCTFRGVRTRRTLRRRYAAAMTIQTHVRRRLAAGEVKQRRTAAHCLEAKMQWAMGYQYLTTGIVD